MGPPSYICCVLTVLIIIYNDDSQQDGPLQIKKCAYTNLNSTV